MPKDKADVFFFVGRGKEETLPEDTVALNCDDSYEGLPDKIREIVRWAVEHGYDYVLKCDDDVILDYERLLSSGYDLHEYTGRANRPPTDCDPFWIPMGFNYWMSRRCLNIIKDAPLPVSSNDDEYWVAKHLHSAGIELHGDHRYRLKYGFTRRKRALRIHRPIPIPGDLEPNEGAFSWCIFLEGNSGNTISIEEKLTEFHKVYQEFVVKPKMEKQLGKDSDSCS